MVAKFLSTAMLTTVLAAGAAQAQSGRTPAEIPPASFTEQQYVDSSGCVFIRAGFNGRTTWVPRFGDNRQPMCGFEPSMAGGSAVASAAPQTAAPAPVTVRTVTTAEVRRPATTTTTTATRPAQPVATASARPYSVPPQTQAQGGAQLYQAQAGALDRRWSFADVTGPSPCTNYNALSQLYAVPSPLRPELPVRCGPQAVHPADALREQSPNGGQWMPWTGVLPAQDNNVYIVPPTYAPRWPQPWLNGASYTPDTPRQPAIRGQVGVTATVSTMGTTAGVTAAAPRAPGRMSNGQYVQVGTYGLDSNAREAVARLRASGMPVATGQAHRGSQPLQVVLAGPFNSQAELNAALGRARAMGYTDAFIR